MFRRWFTVVLLLLQLQPVLAVVPWQVRALAQELEHAVVHQAGHGHHHADHADTLNLQTDSDSTAVSHTHHDAAHHAALLPATDSAVLPVLVTAPLEWPAACRIPEPCLEGPLRPPRCGA